MKQATKCPGANSSNGGSTTLRNAPDVAAEANFDNTTVINGQFASGYGGTSYATPRWAGLIALANQQAAANGTATVGFFNPRLYTLGTSSTYTTLFHDITSGNNKPSAGTGNGFNAVTGYDLVTGWGSPIGAALINNLAGSGTTTSPGYSLAASPASLSVTAGASGASTITVTPTGGFTGSVALIASGLPTGVTGSFSPASTTSTSTLTLATATATPAGTYTITVTGTSGSTTHTTTVSLTVTANSTAAQLIGNPGFENSTATPWTLTTGVLEANGSGESAHTGTRFAWFDGYGTTHTDTGSQTITLPAGKTSATLSYYLHIATAETTKPTAYDKFTVQVYSTTGTLLGTVATYSNLNAASGYQQHTASLASYIGKTVVLKFTGTEDSSLQTSFTLDDVTLTVQ